MTNKLWASSPSIIYAVDMDEVKASILEADKVYTVAILDQNIINNSIVEKI